MSSIDRLLVRGIRSFDPNTSNVIEFYSPLTLIVGHNGSGKTTIIESLKYACTGEFPPGTSKNGAFVNDPKIAGVTQVMAQIKLRFNNVNRRELVVTRSLELIQNKSRLTQRTVETLLLARNPGTNEQVSLSTRCAELDHDIPMHLGVSKAILDSVIFCHQEDSNWPLSEPAALKKRFDDIFAATKYTKALENIKTLRKEQSVQIKLDSQRLEFTNANREKAEKVKATLERTETKIKEHTQTITELDIEIDKLVSDINSLMDKFRTYQKIEGDLAQLKARKKMYEDNCENLRTNFVEYDYSDEMLKKLQTDHKKKLDNYDNQVDELKRQREKLTTDIKLLQSDITKQQILKGNLQSENDAYNRNLSERNRAVREISQRHQFNELNISDFSAEDIQIFIDKLRDQQRKQEEAVKKTRNELEEQENEIDSQLQKLKVHIATQKGAKMNNEKLIDINKKQIKELTKDLDNIEVSKAELENLEDQLRMEETAVQDYSQKAKLYDPMESNAKRKELREVDDKIHQINEDMTVLNRQANAIARLDMAKSAKAKKRLIVTERLEKSEGEFKKIFGRNPVAATIEKEVEELLCKKEKQVRDTEQKLETAKQNLSSIETKLTITNKNLQKMRLESMQNEAAIKDICNETPLSDILERTNSKLAEIQQSLALSTGAKDMYAQFHKHAMEKHECALCRREFLEDEFKQFLEKMEARANVRPEEIKELEQECCNLEKFRETLHSLQPRSDSLIRLRDVEIPAAEKENKDFLENKENLNMKLEKIIKEVDILRAEYKSLQNLQKTATDVSGIEEEVNILNTEIKQLEKDLSTSGNMKTMDELNTILRDLEYKRNEIDREAKHFESESIIIQREFQNRQNRARETKDKLQLMQYKSKERAQLQKRIDRIITEQRELEKSVINLDVEILNIEPKIDKLSTKIKQLRKEMTEKGNTAQDEANQLQQSIDQIQRIEKENQRFINANILDRLQKCEDQIRTLKARIDDSSSEINHINSKVSTFEKEVIELQSIERNIADNIQYRETLRLTQEIGKEIEALENKKSTYSSASYDTQIQALNKRQSKSISKRAGLEGEMKQLNDQAKFLKTELNSEFKNAHEEHRKQMIKLKTEEMANMDLDKYARALDNAIMRYHSMKMDEINKIIQELWVNTYQGNDIDRIEIRSDPSGSGNRSYNYRVVMIKADTELDIRGRCSAGQKVLASIIIRLALAETFCLNCGILALDEPTTNLDRDNIAALAKSLANIIETRRQQANFQLIVITHDEEFLAMLGKSDYADYYYRVFKDIEQHSIIERQRITDDKVCQLQS